MTSIPPRPKEPGALPLSSANIFTTLAHLYTLLARFYDINSTRKRRMKAQIKTWPTKTLTCIPSTRVFRLSLPAVSYQLLTQADYFAFLYLNCFSAIPCFSAFFLFFGCFFSTQLYLQGLLIFNAYTLMLATFPNRLLLCSVWTQLK